MLRPVPLRLLPVAACAEDLAAALAAAKRLLKQDVTEATSAEFGL